MAFRSAIIREALERLEECRAEYQDRLYAEFDKAEDACRGSMLNDKGRRKLIDPISLFSGPAARARCYASPELLEYWERNPTSRMSFEEFETQWLRAQQEHDCGC